MDDLAIRVRGLYKSYGPVNAVQGIDLDVKRGEVFAFLGPNGAGKTTTVEILEGHRRRDAGEINVLGHDPAQNLQDFKRSIGIVLQATAVEPYLTVEETIDVFRGYYPKPKSSKEILDLVGLVEQRKTRVKKLSGGQQRRLDVAIGLAGDPELLFLDEPTTGFDPAARRDAWEMIRGLRSLNKTVFLTTHYMDEAEQLADQVAIIAGGQIVATGPPGELTGLDKITTIRFRIDQVSPEFPHDLAEVDALGNSFFAIRTNSPTKTLHNLTNWAIGQQIELEDLTVTLPSLEDVYLQLVQDVQQADRNDL